MVAKSKYWCKLITFEFKWYLQVLQAFCPRNEPDNAMPLRPSEVGTIRCKGYCPSLTARLLVKRSNRHQEFTNELSLTWGKQQQHIYFHYNQHFHHLLTCFNLSAYSDLPTRIQLSQSNLFTHTGGGLSLVKGPDWPTLLTILFVQKQWVVNYNRKQAN